MTFFEVSVHRSSPDADDWAPFYTSVVVRVGPWVWHRVWYRRH